MEELYYKEGVDGILDFCHYFKEKSFLDKFETESNVSGSLETDEGLLHFTAIKLPRYCIFYSKDKELIETLVKQIQL